jgi:putative ABC transport system ATP-binding protein
MNAGGPQIELLGIERAFRLGDSVVHALTDINLTIDAGEYLSVMGPSGSGKSTLLNMLGLLDSPDAGTYRLEGRDVTTLSATEKARVRSQRIGFVFQGFHLVPRLTAAENIALPMMLAGVPLAQRSPRVDKALADFGLADRARHRHAAGDAARRRAHRQPRSRHRRGSDPPARSPAPSWRDAGDGHA